ncbi:histidinol-phosphate transaminase [Tersicoccus phoenicis]|uniref:Histidinol-phosphate aminotransferase n=1 Tax=Tersicoccus phoenicis TaxID=554083 RepID=A0A1R1L9B7_9MICC|nr:histidinol-phosphate transaminase [Tersicoccus phoenicis]OMH24132.1 histidinol-phosphate transaminase [Tersicoccus phoenicis]
MTANDAEGRLERLAALPLRENLRGATPYGAPQIDVPIQLNVNENTHPLPDSVRDAILRGVEGTLDTLNRYPDREFTTLRASLARYLGHGLDADHLWAANGSNEVLQQLLQAFAGPGRTLMSFPPTYSMYPLLASGTDTRYIAGTREPDFTLTPDAAAAQVRAEAPDVVIVCSPNNPTGTSTGLDVVEAVYAATEQTRSMVIVDEAYVEFAHTGTPSALRLLPGRERLVVSRTMSKAFGMAGTRLGYLAAAPEVTDALRLVRLPYHLSAVTQAVALGALTHADALLATVEDIKAQRDRIVAGLDRLGLTPTPSDANFVLFGPLRDATAVWHGLLDAGVIIRDIGLHGRLRVSAGTEAETTAFLDRMRELVDAGVAVPAR